MNPRQLKAAIPVFFLVVLYWSREGIGGFLLGMACVLFLVGNRKTDKPNLNPKEQAGRTGPWEREE